jgi:hypothetical protein
MRNFLSISFALLILLSGLHITVATHQCSGEAENFEKVSVTGELASCGMENSGDDNTLPGTYFKDHCCDNEVSVFAVDNNYSASSLDFKVFSPNLLQVFIVPVSSTIHSLTAISTNSTDVSPPGNILLSEVSLPKICVFRI